MSRDLVVKLKNQPEKIVIDRIKQIRRRLNSYIQKRPIGKLRPIDDWACELIDPAIQNTEEFIVMREEIKNKLIVSADISLSTKERDLFSLYVERGIDQPEIAIRKKTNTHNITTEISRIKKIVMEQFKSGKKKLSPFDELVMEGQDFSGKTDEEIEIICEERKKKILTAASQILDEYRYEMFLSYYVGNQKKADIARKMETSDGNIDHHVNHSKKRILDHLENTSKISKHITHFDLLVQEEGDVNRTEEELKVLHSERKNKILANKNEVLTPQREKLFLLYFQQGREIPEIAKLLNLSQGSLKNRIAEIKSIIKGALAEDFPKKMTPLDVILRANENTSLNQKEIEVACARKEKVILKVMNKILDKKNNKIFSLYFVEGYSAKEVAGITKTKFNTAKTYIDRIRKEIKEQLDVIEKEGLTEENYFADDTTDKPKRAKLSISEKTAASYGIIWRAYQMGIPFVKIMNRYDIKSYNQFYSIISASPHEEDIRHKRDEAESRLHNRMCKDYENNMLMEDMMAKYDTTHTTILKIVRNSGKADELLKKRKFMYKSLANERQRQIAAISVNYNLTRTEKILSIHNNQIYRDKDFIAEQLCYLEKIPETNPNHMPTEPFSLIGRAAGMFTFDKKLNKRYVTLIEKVKEQGHLDEVYLGVAKTIDEMESRILITQGEQEAKHVFKKTALDIVARCGETFPNDPSYKKIMAFIRKSP